MYHGARPSRMFDIELPSDRITSANLSLHRNRELQRRERIFNAKVRTIGVDQIGLQHQVKEHKEKGESDKASLQAFAADMLHDDKAACILDGRKLKEERLVERAIQDYRHRFQQPHHRREHDLNDPGPLPAAGTAGTPMMPPGLWGEDPGSRARLQRQKEQLREWSGQQQQELDAAKRLQKRADELYDRSRMNVASEALHLQEVEQARKKALAYAVKDYNLARAAENRERRHQARERTEEHKRQADVLNHLQADRELEASQNQTLQAVRQRINFNLHQVEEKKRAELEKRKEEEQAERLRLDTARSAVLLERQQSRTHRMQRRELDHSNAQLAHTQRQQKNIMEKERFGGFDDRFFAKFNTSTR